MKTIYTILNDRIYKINQNTAVPTTLTFRAPGVSTSLKEDVYNKDAILSVFINTLKKPGTKSNRELYEEMIEMMRQRCITEVTTIQNKFKIYVEYCIFEDSKEVDHQSVMKPIEPLDKAYLLGCATNNETVYRRVKTFNPKLEFKIKNSLPHGINANPRQTYTFKILNIAIFEDFSSKPEYHGAQYGATYDLNSSTINAALGNMVQVYSTENAGVDIAPISLSYIPRTVTIDIDCTLANLIVAYNGEDVDKVIIENIERKYPQPDTEVEVPTTEDPKHLIPEDETKKSADGQYTPDKDGYFSWYERTTDTNPKSLLVVEDAIPDGNYDVSSMIKKAMIIADIPDIEVGEYVIFCEALNYNGI